MHKFNVQVFTSAGTPWVRLVFVIFFIFLKLWSSFVLTEACVHYFYLCCVFSWYSWALHSIVNGVYAFGFLFMLPQLFVNYRLRSVAALPWRAFMYKAFNTFIDDVFAFIITMPTAHRVACFRDDLVFLVYLYQRWWVWFRCFCKDFLEQNVLNNNNNLYCV